MLSSLPDGFWERAHSASERMLMLDYDGTLAPFHVLRMQARPPESTVKILTEILEAGHTRIVLVSGRPTQQVRTLLDDLNVEVFGAHGFERSTVDGVLTRQELSEKEIAGLEAAKNAATSVGLEEFLELKPASIAVHVRGLEPDKSLEVEELSWNIYTPIAEKFDLECRAFNGGVELRSRRYHKGTAVDILLAESSPDVFAVYLGDDDTDEDAFKTISGRGVGVKVGSDASDSAAQGYLETQEEVEVFLRRWHQAVTHGRSRFTASRRKSRLVVISNRLPALEKDAQGGRRKPVGGLATALEAALSQSEAGGLWMGWSGKTLKTRRAPNIQDAPEGNLRLMGVDLTSREYEAYYNGFCNNTIWPLFHNFPTLAKMSGWQLEVYRSVNAMFANQLIPQLQENDLVWAHDYHLMLLGDELRQAGWGGRLGFFLHIPFPSLDNLAILPDFMRFLLAMQEFDLIGFQTRTYMDNYVQACKRALGSEWDGYVLRTGERFQRVGAYPIGIDVNRFLPDSTFADRNPRKKSLRDSFGGREIIIGVDRLDYTKGMPERILAFEKLLSTNPKLRKKISFMQISSPSRTQVPEYIEQKQRMDSLVGRINGEMGEHDWEPIRYLYRTYTQDKLTEFYRDSRVGLVTPLRDGMNLVAKEYIAAQYPDNPGTLVLSRFAGAVEELEEAVIVNPYLPEDTAQGIALALEMSLEERIDRHQAMLKKISHQTVNKWARDFLFDLQSI